MAGFGGMRHDDGELRFSPRLPLALDRLAFRLRVRGRRLRVEIRHGEVTYELLAGEPLSVYHDGERIEVAEDAPQVRTWSVQDPGPAPTQPHGRLPERHHPAPPEIR